eukprot:gene26939-33124_t
MADITSLSFDHVGTGRVAVEVEADMANKCFVCGHERSALDDCRHTNFLSHIQSTHNPWHYMSYFMYVMSKSSSERTGLESFVHAQLEANQIRFLPLNRSLDLERDKVSQLATTNNLLTMLQSIHGDVQEILRSSSSKRLEEYGSDPSSNDNRD